MSTLSTSSFCLTLDLFPGSLFFTIGPLGYLCAQNVGWLNLHSSGICLDIYETKIPSLVLYLPLVLE